MFNLLCDAISPAFLWAFFEIVNEIALHSDTLQGTQPYPDHALMYHDEQRLTLQENRYHFALLYKQNRNEVPVTEFYVAVPESPVQSNSTVDGLNFIPCQNGE